MRMAHAASGALVALAAACSAPEEVGVPPVTLDEQGVIAEARTMIPAAETAPAPEPQETRTP